MNPSALRPCTQTRSARWVSNSANVPRFVLRPNLLLDFATLDTQRTLLAVVGGIAWLRVNSRVSQALTLSQRAREQVKTAKDIKS